MKQVRFDTDAELDLAVRTSSVPLRITVKTPRSRTSSAAGRDPQAGVTGASSSSRASRSLPSTPGYAVASNVGSVTGDDDADMIMVDLPPGGAPMASGPAGGIGGAGSSDGGGAGGGGGLGGGSDLGVGEAGAENENDKEDIDAPAAFEAEAAAARDPEGSVLYQKASVRLARRFKVHLTPTQLWRVMALFQIQGRQLVIFGLAPHTALDASADPASAGVASSDEEGNGAAARSGGVKRSKTHVARGLVANPVQRLLSLNGVELPEEEVQPLLEALRVRPRRLVKLNLLPADVLEDIPDDHREGRGSRGGPSGHPGHGHGHGPGGRFLFGRGGRGRGRGGGRGGPSMPFQPSPPFHGHYGGHGSPPPPHMMGRSHMEPPHGHNQHGHGNHPPHQHMHGPHHPPPPPMWHPFPGGFGGPPEGGYGYGGYGYGGPYGGGGGGGGGGGSGGGGWHEWTGPFGGGGGGGGRGGGGRGGGSGGGGGGPECGGAKRGFGKGTKDNMAMARFVSHTSGSDVAKVAPGQTFKKSWLVRNDSTTTWPETCSLIPVSQSCADLSSPPEAPIVGDVAPGEEATVSVDLVAPLQPGMYEGYWRARDSSARKFGQRLWAKVMVVGPGQDVNAAVERLSLDENGNKDN